MRDYSGVPEALTVRGQHGEPIATYQALEIYERLAKQTCRCRFVVVRRGKPASFGRSRVRGYSSGSVVSGQWSVPERGSRGVMASLSLHLLTTDC